MAYHRLDRLLGWNLRQFRIRAKLTQADLGEAIGVTCQQIQKYESGANRISAVRLFMASKVLQVPIEVFYEETRAVSS
ncbi:helix-turn-helix transcriptional regulator [Rhodomicrobium vannielii ATCC 17100]|jgi:transcriptional regulator with XRE-family HTH domain|uniref:helix-turn-helix transcriptional regulator n=1 Tax=Rhodomicrobium vannielii TaxID=1069 RepID=UPI001918493B|nr:helix-turn-helix transcriptional regulator [Rhodomicrobium vannielii]MBJ7532940.1 helix-turn-helix transcriptional regulator [Rhodomicrobium vannielii ATCC 17100]